MHCAIWIVFMTSIRKTRPEEMLSLHLRLDQV